MKSISNFIFSCYQKAGKAEKTIVDFIFDFDIAKKPITAEEIVNAKVHVAIIMPNPATDTQ